LLGQLFQQCKEHDQIFSVVIIVFTVPWHIILTKVCFDR
jgi:hypothetical protein